MSSDVGMRRGQASPRGLNHIRMLADAKVLSRHCKKGELVAIDGMNALGPGGQPIVSPDQDGLSEEYAEHLIKHGKAERAQPKWGEKAISVKPKPPQMLPSGNEWAEIEAATDQRPAQAERAVAPRGKAAV